MRGALTTRTVAILVIALGLLAAACGRGAPEASFAPIESPEQAAAPGPYGVGVVTLTFTDTSRPTDANRDFAGSAERALEVEVWYPADAPSGLDEARDAPLAAEKAPYPLVVLSHGFSASRRLYTSYGTHLASHGFVVAAPDFPLTHLGAPGGPRFGDLVNQPADVSFVIDRLLELGAGSEPPLAGAIDGERIGATGHSLGGATTFLATYGALADGRIDAAVPIAPAGCADREFFAGTRRPLMVIEGQQDLFVADARAYYEAAPPPKYLVSIAGANHIRFADSDIQDEVALEALSKTWANRLEEFSGDFGRISQATGLSVGGCPPRPSTAGGDTSVPLIEGERQRELLRLYATLFFSATLRDDESARQLLQGESHPPEVEFQFEEPEARQHSEGDVLPAP